MTLILICIQKLSVTRILVVYETFRCHRSVNVVYDDDDETDDGDDTKVVTMVTLLWLG